MKKLFELNPALDRAALAQRFAETGRVQIRDVLTEETAREMNRSERSVQGLIDRAKKRMQDALGRLSNHR